MNHKPKQTRRFESIGESAISKLAAPDSCAHANEKRKMSGLTGIMIEGHANHTNTMSKEQGARSKEQGARSKARSKEQGAKQGARSKEQPRTTNEKEEEEEKVVVVVEEEEEVVPAASAFWAACFFTKRKLKNSCPSSGDDAVPLACIRTGTQYTRMRENTEAAALVLSREVVDVSGDRAAST